MTMGRAHCDDAQSAMHLQPQTCRCSPARSVIQQRSNLGMKAGVFDHLGFASAQLPGRQRRERQVQDADRSQPQCGNARRMGSSGGPRRISSLTACGSKTSENRSGNSRSRFALASTISGEALLTAALICWFP